MTPEASFAASPMAALLLAGLAGLVFSFYTGVEFDSMAAVVIDGTLSNWRTKIATGALLFALVTLQQGLVTLARRPAVKHPGAAS